MAEDVALRAPSSTASAAHPSWDFFSVSLSATNRKFWVTFNAAHDSLVSFFKVELLQERLASAVPMLCYWLLPALEQVLHAVLRFCLLRLSAQQRQPNEKFAPQNWRMQYLQKVCVLDIFFGLFSREGKQVDIILSQLKKMCPSCLVFFSSACCSTDSKLSFTLKKATTKSTELRADICQTFGEP